MHVLIVDDEPKDFLISAIGSLPGHKVTLKKSLESAWTFLKENTWAVDLVFIDEVFKNTDADSVFKGGLELGTALEKEMRYLPKVMFTGNADSRDHARNSFVKGGFIDYYPKSDVNKRTIKEILESIRELTEFKEKMQDRYKGKRTWLLEIFRSLNKGQRDELKGYIGRGERLLHQQIKLGDLMVDVDQWLTGIADPYTLINEDASQIILKLLDETESNTVFHGHWREGTPTRDYLKKYEIIESRSAVQYSNDFHAASILLEIFDFATTYKGDQPRYLAYYNLERMTDAISPTGKANDTLFRKKMVARRVLICCSRAFNRKLNDLSLVNVVLLLVKGNTGTYKVTNLPEKGSRIYHELSPGLEPKHIVNTILGLSYESTYPKGEFQIKDYYPYILNEEDAFYLTIGQHMKALKRILSMEIPESCLPDDYSEKLETLQDLKRLVVAVKNYSADTYESLLRFLKVEILNLNKGATAALAYLLETPL